MRDSTWAIHQKRRLGFTSSISRPSRLTPCPLTDFDEADRIADQRSGELLPFHNIGNPLPVTPVCDPDDFLRRSRHKSRQAQLGHASIDDRLNHPSFFLKASRVERDRIGPPVGQGREVWEPFRIVEHADYPKMVECPLRNGRILPDKPYRRRATGSIQG